MKIKLKPKKGKVKTNIEIVSESSLKINNELFEFSTTEDGEFQDINTETNNSINKAVVVDNVLILDIPYSYTDVTIWENPNYNDTGNFRGSDYEEFVEGDIV